MLIKNALQISTPKLTILDNWLTNGPGNELIGLKGYVVLPFNPVIVTKGKNFPLAPIAGQTAE